jgi:hypothetical protein
VIIVLGNPEIERRVEGVIGPFFARQVAPSDETAGLAARVADTLRNAMAAEHEGLKSTLFESAKKRDLDTLYRNARPLDDGPPLEQDPL